MKRDLAIFFLVKRENGRFFHVKRDLSYFCEMRFHLFFICEMWKGSFNSWETWLSIILVKWHWFSRSSWNKNWLKVVIFIKCYKWYWYDCNCWYSKSFYQKHLHFLSYNYVFGVKVSLLFSWNVKKPFLFSWNVKWPYFFLWNVIKDPPLPPSIYIMKIYMIWSICPASGHAYGIYCFYLF